MLLQIISASVEATPEKNLCVYHSVRTRALEYYELRRRTEPEGWVSGTESHRSCSLRSCACVSASAVALCWLAEELLSRLWKGFMGLWDGGREEVLRAQRRFGVPPAGAVGLQAWRNSSFAALVATQMSALDGCGEAWRRWCRRYCGRRTTRPAACRFVRWAWCQVQSAAALRDTRYL